MKRVLLASEVVVVRMWQRWASKKQVEQEVEERKVQLQGCRRSLSFGEAVSEAD